MHSDLLSTIFGVTTIIAAALAGLTWGTVKTLRTTAEDLRNRVGDLEKQRVIDKAEIEKLVGERDALARVVTGEVHWTALTDLLEEHHRDAKAHWVMVVDILQQLIDGNGKV